MTMTTQKSDTLAAGIVHPFLPLSLHYLNGSPLVLKQFLPHSSITAAPVDNKQAQLPSALIMDVEVDGIKQTMTVFGMKGDAGTPGVSDINGTKVSVNYGSIQKELPFAVHLNDFILKRYPGSESPSWFESSVRLIDRKRGIDRQQRIYMNNILKYQGYRLYQASYDKDELGSVLAVNHDGLGTIVTYLGYLLLAIGFVLSLVNRNSRFAWLWRSASRTSGIARIVVTMMLLGSLAATSYSQDTLPAEDTVSDYHSRFNSELNELPVINEDLAMEFDTVLVQDNGGRIEPMNTLSSEILRKVVRKEKYNGQTPGQVILGMMAFPQYWLHEPMILVNHPEIQKQLRISGKYASFLDFFSSDGEYLLRQDVEEAYRKKPAYRSKYDNELIRTDERLNICNMIFSQTALKIFPDPDDTTHTWYTPVNSEGIFSSGDSIFVRHGLEFLFLEIQKSEVSHDWTVPVTVVRTAQNVSKE